MFTPLLLSRSDVARRSHRSGEQKKDVMSNAQALVEQALAAGRLDDLAASLDAAELQVEKEREKGGGGRERERETSDETMGEAFPPLSHLT